MNVLVTLNAGLGANLGPNFNLTANVGVVTPNTATLSELLNGKLVVADDNATQIVVESTGTCTNSIILNIGALTTTTSTSTTTAGSTTTSTTLPPTTTTSTSTTSTSTSTVPKTSIRFFDQPFTLNKYFY